MGLMLRHCYELTFIYKLPRDFKHIAVNFLVVLGSFAISAK